jgi:hypothetical protein
VGAKLGHSANTSCRCKTNLNNRTRLMENGWDGNVSSIRLGFVLADVLLGLV